MRVLAVSYWALLPETSSPNVWANAKLDTNSNPNANIDNEITKKLRIEVKKWGINVEKVTLTDIGLISSIRLFNENIINS